MERRCVCRCFSSLAQIADVEIAIPPQILSSTDPLESNEEHLEACKQSVFD